MNVKTNLKIGGVVIQFEVDEKDDLEAINKAATLANPPSLCTNCNDDGFENKKLVSNKHNGIVFVNIQCKCGAKAKLGQYKEGGYFWHREYTVYKKEEE